jgi:hypothetical protein
MDACDEERIDKANAAIRTIENTVPTAPPPVIDLHSAVAGLLETFASFRAWEFADQRPTLKRVLRSVPL